MKTIKITLVSILAILLSLSCLLCYATAADTENEAKSISNVIVCVRFANDLNDVFNSDNDYGNNNWRELKGMYNDTSDLNQYGIDLSFKKYISEISNNQLTVENFFPQDNGTTVNVLTLPNNRDYYTDDYYVIEEVIKATNDGRITIPTSTKLDYRETEVLDNLTVIFQVDGYVDNDEMLYPHKSIAANSTKLAGRAYVRCYNFLNSYSVFSSQFQGVISHEFMHSLGFNDLYRYSGNGAPVGGWDIMSQTGRYLQYPLTYFRSQMGWVSIDKITSNGTYTLNPVTTKEGNQAFIIETPMSDSEFFVVEYRVRETAAPASLAFESKVPQTGLLVYRINNSIEELSNSMGNDYVYVFRPDETSLTASEGSILYASVSPSSTYNPRTAIGSTDLTKLFTEDTIFYSDGRNSGISISNVELNNSGDSLTFDVTFADYASIDMWEKLGENIDNSSSNISIFTQSDNEIYLAYETPDYPSSVKVSKWNGTGWNTLGNSISNAASPTIEKVGNILYLFYQKNGTPTVAKYNGAEWITIGSTSANSYPQACDIITDGTEVYITYTISDSASVLHVDRITASGLTSYATYSAPGYIANPELCFFNGSLYAVLSVFDGSNAFILKETNGVFSNIRSVPMTYSNSHGIAASNGKLYCYFSKASSPALLDIYDGAVWSDNTISELNGVYSVSQFNVYNGIPFITQISGSNNTLRVYSYEDGVLSQLGSDVVNNGNGVSLSVHGNTVYAASSSGTNGVLNVRFKELDNVPPELTGISISALPNKTDYTVGDLLDTTGLTLSLTYSDSSTKTVSSGFTCIPASLLSYGNNNITVSYNNFTTTFEVFVDCSTSSHVWNSGVVTLQPTCGSQGTMTYTCTLCNDTKTEIINATGLHNWNNPVITSAASCTENGMKLFTCSICSNTKSVTIEAYGHHDYSSVYTPATCHVNAYTTYTCAEGDDSYSVEIEGSVLSHNWDSGTVTKQATCTTEGTIRYTCTLCSETKEQSVAKLSHIIRTEIVNADCTNKGYSRDICSVCGTVVRTYNEVPALGHVDGNGDGVCDQCSEPIGSSSDDCDCICHSTGFKAFIYKILRFFYKLFGINKTCECGVEHY